ncbi:MAG: thioredoxin family protein, partial [Alphaproteobacteria bacterium]|nr:thioredoxin family protein [Alphaproteobacteria bacterium]
DIAEIISYGVMSTPAIVIDDKVAFVGGIPSEDEVNKWFNEPTSCCCGCCK